MSLKLKYLVSGTHTLNIHGYSFTKGMGIGKFISSDSFSIGEYSMQIQFYPDGDGHNKEVNNDENGEVYVSLFIELTRTSNHEKRPQKVSTGYSLLDQNGNKWTNPNKSTSHYRPENKIMVWCLGHSKFYKRTELEASQFIKDDCLTIQCTVSVEKNDSSGPKPVGAQLSELGQKYGQLLESKEDSDVTLEVEGETFYAHKFILSVWSPVFKQQLREENTQCIQIKGIRASVFKALLHFIYNGVIPNDGEDSESFKDVRFVSSLLVAAHRYVLERLKSLCESVLCESIDENTVAWALVLAEVYGCIKLKSTCLEFIVRPENLYAVMQTKAFKCLQVEYPSVLVDLIKASGRVIDDCLSTQSTVGVVKTIMDRPKAQLSEVGQRYGQLLESKEGSDVSFEVEGETFHAHKVILSTWSPVFKAQLFGPLKEENAHCIKIEDIQAPVFKALLHFIYYDVIPEEEDLTSLEVIILIQHLLVAADRYGSQRLKSLCESILCRNISQDTVASTLALAEQQNCTQLKSTCLEFIVLPENLYAVMQTDGFKNLKESLPSVLVDLIKALGRIRDYTCVTYG